jgi:hypothetical protein
LRRGLFVNVEMFATQAIGPGQLVRQYLESLKYEVVSMSFPDTGTTAGNLLELYLYVMEFIPPVEIVNFLLTCHRTEMQSRIMDFLKRGYCVLILNYLQSPRLPINIKDIVLYFKTQIGLLRPDLTVLIDSVGSSKVCAGAIEIFKEQPNTVLISDENVNFECISAILNSSIPDETGEIKFYD